mgnify:FL=1
MATVLRGFTATSDRCRAWLRYLYPAVATPDHQDKDRKLRSLLDKIENTIKMLLLGVAGGAIAGVFGPGEVQGW